MDGTTEFVETSDQAPGLNGFGPAVEVFGPEIVVEGAMLEHMVGSGEDRGGAGPDRLFRAVSGAQALELRLEIAAVFAGGRPPRRTGSGWSSARGAPRLRARRRPRTWRKPFSTMRGARDHPPT